MKLSIRILSLIFFLTIELCNAQETNNYNLDFEMWQDSFLFGGAIYDTIIADRASGMPINWAANSIGNSKTVSKTTESSKGDYALVLSGFYQFEKAKIILGNENSGLPINFRPEILTGDYKTVLLGTYSDSLRGYVDVYLTKFDFIAKKRDTIGQAKTILKETDNEYQKFELSIRYLNNNIIPDSIHIELSKYRFGYGGPIDLCYECSHVYFDNLALDTFTSTFEQKANNSFSCYPNPYKDGFVLHNQENTWKDFIIYDIDGKVVANIKIPPFSKKLYFDNYSGGSFLIVTDGKQHIKLLRSH